MKQFNELIQEKVNSFEYSYEEGSWESLQRKMKLRKVLRWGIAALVAVTIVTSSILLLNNKNTHNKWAKASISIVDTNKPAVKNEEINLNKDKKSKDNYLNQKIQSASSENVNIPNQTINNNDENINKNIQNISPIQNQFNSNTNTDNTDKIVVDFKKSVSKGCVPLKVHFNNLCSNKNVSFIWNFGDGSTSHEQDPSHEYQKAGKYLVQLTIKDNEGNIISSEAQEIHAYNKPKANFEYKIENNRISLVNTSKHSSFVKWKINDTIDFKEETNYCIRKSGKYLLTLTVENNFGCLDSSSQSLDLIYKLPINFANAITPNGDGINDLFGPIVADYSDYEFKMYIYNKEGRCIFKCFGSPVYWDGTDQNSKQPCPADIYFYKVLVVDKMKNKNEFSGKINLKR